MRDKRLTLANDRVVHHALADAFPELEPVGSQDCRVCVAVADIRRTPHGPRERQLRYGEAFEVIDRREGHAFGLSGESNPYAGWVAEETLTTNPDMGHDPRFVITRQTHAYSEPDFKSSEIAALTHLSRVGVIETSGRFSRTELGWIPSNHLGSAPADDPASIADIYLGTPYLWGGNTCWGIDCSGLVQAAQLACGRAFLGDSDQQAAHERRSLPPNTSYQRGDLLFWKGHVAMVTDPETLIHANAFHMAVTYEPIMHAIARIESQGDGLVTKHARLT